MTLTLNEREIINELSPVYFPNELDIAKRLFLPIAQASDSFDCMSGYFSSHVLAELAGPLAILFKKPSSSGRFLISPCLSESDQKALLEAYSQGESIYEFLVDEEEINQDKFKNSTLEVMKFLIARKRLDIRIVLMKKGMMHAKIWNFNTPWGKVVIHGSGNATKSGLMTNFEQLVFSREWESDSSRAIVKAYEERFSSFWDGNREDAYTLRLNDRTVSDILKKVAASITDTQYQKLVEDLGKYMEDNPESTRLKIPSWLSYRDGDYRHQGEAVDAWLANSCRGTLEIATGGGKTLTSLVCASLGLKDQEAAILIIAVPTLPLIKQWADDVRNFSVEPLDTEGMGTQKLVQHLRKLIKEHEILPKHSVVIITHDNLKNENVQAILRKYKSKVMLIGDEAHNLGSASFVDDPPENIEFRLALSATPIRQYDPEGTEKLLKYFGDVVYQFPLEEAIGKCLVPFEYVAHKVFLNEEEATRWIELTEKINRLRWSDDTNTKKVVEQLQIRRRAISEAASQKITVFSKEVSKLSDRVHSLAFCTDKNPVQLDAVNLVLKDQGFIYHQITGIETSNKTLMKSLIDSYKIGNIDILTSKRVLDEGFNIPPIKTAFFLASSGTVRTWVQRLGRVLRKSEDTGKEKAVIHDFIVFPPGNSPDYGSLIGGELKRMQWFMNLALKNSSLNKAMTISDSLLSIKEKI
ncbi:DEAD/DEAH box helicase family protein [Pseudidiomarina sp. 1APP75-32.1]|uniref:DEAD/DEAH box helicase family protein n=1 Tax=Pseudidiomarina terrestris TaxID=2820060 RepID=A0AAW7R0Q2_9GAMM|nr:DEAD/DEAH box helicase family protein [Pseudidiomarina sp. 1APP75-32.1]MDN7124868.1 DEAD/DEAH box helicase family protein [Pseudidiomarina sp. 1APP75-32.1]